MLFLGAMTGLAFLPMTLVNFAVALQVPRPTRIMGRRGNARLLALGLAVCLAGMAWLSRASPATGYLGNSLALALLLMARDGRTAPSACLSGTRR